MFKKHDKVKFSTMVFPPWIHSEIEKREIYGAHIAKIDVEQVLTVSSTNRDGTLVWLVEDHKPEVGFWHGCFELIEAAPEEVEEQTQPDIHIKGQRTGKSLEAHKKNPHLTTIDHYKKIIDSNTEKAIALEGKI
jgi:hypothetical protein